MMTKLTPAMQQYKDLKQQNPDCVLFFRLGDFYEMFREDAKLSAKLLDLTLTSKNKNAPHPIPMAGVPHHSAEKYIERLVAHGYKVAIAEQTSTPKPGTLVEREVVSIVTPGTYLYEDSTQSRYVMALYQQDTSDGLSIHVAWGDFADGHYYTRSFAQMELCAKRIMIMQPMEIILDPDFAHRDALYDIKKQLSHLTVSLFDPPHDASMALQHMLGVSGLDGYGQALGHGRMESLGLLLHYLHHTQLGQVHVHSVHYHHDRQYVLMDDVTIRNLELFSSRYDHNTHHSLFGVLNTTVTSMGSRLLSHRLVQPVQDLTVINSRVSQIDFFVQEQERASNVHDSLKQCHDLPKLISTIIYRKPWAGYLAKLRNNLTLIYEHPHLIDGLRRVGCAEQTIEGVQYVYDELKRLLQEEISDNASNYIADGIDEHIDDLRKRAYRSDERLMEYQHSLSRLSGVSAIKIKYIRNQGYYLEVTPAQVEAFESIIDPGVPGCDIVRRQTLKSAQRYTSTILTEIEYDIVQAKDQLVAAEQVILDGLISLIKDHHLLLSQLSDAIARLDIYTSHALLVHAKQLCRPTMTTTGPTTLTAARHLVIEHFLPHDQHFIPNDFAIGETQGHAADHGTIHILTGPNMGGKSTYLRQNAHCVLLAHCGLYVPAKQATIRSVDALFARVGSGDALSKNQSTFMTEMIEVANIVHNSSERSFIVFDELGRGTATYDGLALTRAIIEYVAHHIGAQTLLATHYHELTALEGQTPGVVNYAVSVYENNKEVVFLKKVVRGGADKSYGIEVAKLAGIPSPIIQLARGYLSQLESDAPATPSINMATTPSLWEGMVAPTDARYEKFRSLIQSYDINRLTPLQALQILQKIQDEME